MPLNTEAGLIKSRFIRCEYRKGVRLNNEKVQEHLHKLERVPQNLQKCIAESGAYIVFFNGQLTDNFEAVNEKGVTPSGWDNHYTWDDIPAAYDDINFKAILVGIEGNYAKTGSHLFLHEFGHCFNDEIGRILFKKPISETDAVVSAIQREPFLSLNGYLQRPKEYVAHSIEKFYLDETTKLYLKIAHPRIYGILSNIEDHLS